MMMRPTVLAVAMMGCGAAALGAQSTTGNMPKGPAPGTPEHDKKFVLDAAKGSNAEIQMSEIALKHGKSDEVKSFAKMMIEDHTKLKADMMPVAQSMGINKPPADAKKADRMGEHRLRAADGDDFDKEYVKAMVAAHHKDLGMFMAERESTTNEQLKAVVASGTEVIRHHTEMIDSIAQKMGLPTPPMPGM